MKALVTGGAGFIASHLSDRLVELGHDVVIVDDLSKGKLENLPAQAKFYEMDISDKALADVFEAERPEVVFHHAAHADVTQSVRDPAHDASVNILGSLNLLECCRAAQGAQVHLRQHGWCAVRRAPVHPRRRDPPHRPGVALRRQQARGGAVPLCLPREPRLWTTRHCATPTCTGRGRILTARRAWWPSSPCSCSPGRQPVIFGDGSKTRDYCYVGDIVEANILALNSDVSGIYNLGPASRSPTWRSSRPCATPWAPRPSRSSPTSGRERWST